MNFRSFIKISFYTSNYVEPPLPVIHHFHTFLSKIISLVCWRYAKLYVITSTQFFSSIPLPLLTLATTNHSHLLISVRSLLLLTWLNHLSLTFLILSSMNPLSPCTKQLYSYSHLSKCSYNPINKQIHCTIINLIWVSEGTLNVNIIKIEVFNLAYRCKPTTPNNKS